MSPTPEQIRERAELWAQALEANNGKECRGQMRDDKGNRCCLAVAEDVYLANEDKSRVERYCKGLNYPQPKVANWFGWGDEANPLAMPDTRFSNLNDDGISHAWIAKRVRAKWCEVPK